MAKFFGPVGYAMHTETAPGVWKDAIIPHNHYGDVLQNHMRPQSTDNVNDNIVVSNQISIVADPFAMSNFHNIKYVDYMGTRWRITSVDVQYPRLLLTLGGVYNG